MLGTTVIDSDSTSEAKQTLDGLQIKEQSGNWSPPKTPEAQEKFLKKHLELVDLMPGEKLKVTCIQPVTRVFRVNWWGKYKVLRSKVLRITGYQDHKPILKEI